jgi:hypothetical protein
MTRLSCHRFRANEVRLWLSLIAYNLGNLWRRLALPSPVANWSLTSLQQRLVKTGGRLIQHARYYWLLLAESHLTRRLFADMLRKVAALPLPAGIRRVQREANLDDGAGLAGKVSADAPGKRVLSARCVLAGGETGSFRRQWEHCRPIPAETLAGSDRPAYTGVGSGVKTEIPVKMPRKRKSLAFVF